MQDEYLITLTLRFDTEAERDTFHTGLRTYLLAEKAGAGITSGSLNKTERQYANESSESMA